jgi:large subunit ribosomal protein L9
MKVILNQTVPKVGKAGTVVTVADGFARNFLFPRGLAIVADKRQINALEIRNARIAAKTAGEKTEAEGVREKLHGQTVRIEGQVGKGQTKLFGAITAQDIVDAIQKQLGVAVDRKKVALVEPIKRLGTTDVEIDLHREVDAIVHVVVFDPTAPVEAPKAEPAAEPAVEVEA